MKNMSILEKPRVNTSEIKSGYTWHVCIYFYWHASFVLLVRLVLNTRGQHVLKLSQQT